MCTYNILVTQVLKITCTLYLCTMILRRFFFLLGVGPIGEQMTQNEFRTRVGRQDWCVWSNMTTISIATENWRNHRNKNIILQCFNIVQHYIFRYKRCKGDPPLPARHSLRVSSFGKYLSKNIPILFIHSNIRIKNTFKRTRKKSNFNTFSKYLYLY